MKRNDIIYIALIALTVSTITYFVARSYLSNTTAETIKIKTVETVTSNLNDPDPTIFNKDAINTSVLITIQKSSGQ